jgi:hypothetical protein
LSHPGRGSLPCLRAQRPSRACAGGYEKCVSFARKDDTRVGAQALASSDRKAPRPHPWVRMFARRAEGGLGACSSGAGLQTSPLEHVATGGARRRFRSGLRAAMRVLEWAGATGKHGFRPLLAARRPRRPTAVPARAGCGRGDGSLVSVLGFRVDLQKSTGSARSDRFTGGCGHWRTRRI